MSISTYEWQDRFKSGDYIHTYNGYSPYYLGIFYGVLKIPLGGEEEFLHCANFFSGVGDVEWWDKREINKLTDEQRIKLNNILHRNTKIDSYIEEHFDLLKTCFVGVEKYKIYRLSNKYKIFIIYLMENLHGVDDLIKYCYDNDIKELDFVIENPFKEDLDRYSNKIFKENLEKNSIKSSTLCEENDNEFYSKLIDNVENKS